MQKLEIFENYLILKLLLPLLRISSKHFNCHCFTSRHLSLINWTKCPLTYQCCKIASGLLQIPNIEATFDMLTQSNLTILSKKKETKVTEYEHKNNKFEEGQGHISTVLAR